MIVDEKKPQASRFRKVSVRCLWGRNHRFVQDIKRHCKTRATVLSFAFDANGARVELHQRLRNGQPKTETAELPDNGNFALFESMKNPRLVFGFDSDAGIGDLKRKPPSFIRSPNRDSPSLGSKLHRVVQ